MRQWAYESTARMLKHFGFTNFKQVEQCIAPYDDDALSRAVHGGTRQGQLSRFEDMVQAAFGESFMEGYPSLRDAQWWTDYKARQLERIRATGVPVGTFTAPNPWPPTHGSGASVTTLATANGDGQRAVRARNTNAATHLKWSQRSCMGLGRVELPTSRLSGD
jgi:hypothetical protein